MLAGEDGRSLSQDRRRVGTECVAETGRMASSRQPSVAKLTINLPWKVWEALSTMAEEDGISKTEALRRCISTEAFRRSVEKEGGRLVVEGPDGSRERVNFPY
jgi:hypothetical protein